MTWGKRTAAEREKTLSKGRKRASCPAERELAQKEGLGETSPNIWKKKKIKRSRGIGAGKVRRPSKQRKESRIELKRGRAGGIKESGRSRSLSKKKHGGKAIYYVPRKKRESAEQKKHHYLLGGDS